MVYLKSLVSVLLVVFSFGVLYCGLKYVDEFDVIEKV